MRDQGFRLSGKSRWIALILAVLALGALIFGVVRAVSKAREDAYRATFGQTAGTVGGYNVTYELYRAFYLKYRAPLAKKGETKAALDRAVRARTEEALCGLYATVSLAASAGLSPEDADVKVAAEEELDAIKTYYEENELDFDKELEDGHMSEALFTYLLRIDALEEKLFVKFKADGRIPTDDAELLEILSGDGVLRLSWIYIEDGEGETHEDNRAVAEAAVAELDGGELYATVCAHYSEDKSMDASGAYLCYGEMPQTVYDAAAALAEGEYGGVLETEDGYYIVCRLPKDEAYLLENFDELKAAYQSAELSRKIAESRRSLSFTEGDMLRKLSGEDIH
ncbi:MAG: peptidylprolyl isomerase [Clostridia bacterium]|nr:peptidylprolyl isomerase [Clostridia bacterium]